VTDALEDFVRIFARERGLATPNIRRQGFLSFPKMSCNNSEAASATFD
jgi:hypothetical protein